MGQGMTTPPILQPVPIVMLCQHESLDMLQTNPLVPPPVSVAALWQVVESEEQFAWPVGPK
jgi:hypothetical protein